jgi:hypothetical protein
VAPGEQTPWQDAFPDVSVTHAWLLQAVPVFQAPVPSQVCTAPLEQRVELGAHTPWQPPLTQAWLPQSDGALQAPAVHVSTPLLTHCVAPPVHAPPSPPSLSVVASAASSVEGASAPSTALLPSVASLTVASVPVSSGESTVASEPGWFPASP